MDSNMCLILFAYSCVALVFSGAFSIDLPKNCEWNLQDAGKNQVSLDCNIRTFGSDWNTSWFNSDLSSHISSLSIQCSDVLFFQSSLVHSTFQPLYHMRQLAITHCKLTTIPDGAFLGLDNLQNLTLRTYNGDWSAMALELTVNSLVGMPRLESLDFGQNNLWHLPNGVLCPLGLLRHLNLTKNRLQDVAEVGALGSCGTHLRSLDMSVNDLVTLPDRGLAGLQSLNKLYIQYNHLSIVGDHALQGLSVLQVLNMSSNHLVTLPPDLFNKTTGLREIYLQNNSLSVIAPGIFTSLDQLSLLDMSMNRFTSEWLTGETFNGLRRLVVLNLSNNHLTQIHSLMFQDLLALQKLDLSYNDITKITDRVFLPMANLHHLDLSFNKLSIINGQSLAGLGVLSVFYVANNNISVITNDAFDNCSGVKEVHLEYNALISIPEAFRSLTSLMILYINHNSISTMNQEDLTQVKSLKHLHMSSNLLDRICKNCFDNLTELKLLDLSRNDIQLIPQGTFDTNTQLEVLRLDGNKVTDINGLFSSLSNLLWLNISDNRITWFDFSLIPIQLLHLDIHENHIQDIGNYFHIKSKIKLQTFDASHNIIESIGPSSVPNGCELLFLNSNKISKIAPGTFVEKNKLIMVDLYDNLLSQIDLNSIKILPVKDEHDLPEFYIGGNPFFCDCHMEWMHRVHQISALRQHPRVMDLDKVICTLPYTRYEENRLALLETEPSQFLCPYAAHCFALCHCCEFMACDCQMTCPDGCFCYHDETWSTNIVDCSNRKHRHLPEDIPMDATTVFMDANVISNLEAHNFIGHKNLQSLYLNGSKIVRIQNRTFHGLTSLRELHLQDNMIAELKGFEFEHLDHLKDLYLQNNQLKFIRNSTFARLKSLEILRLDRNFLFNYPVWNLRTNIILKEVTLGVNLWSCECHFINDFKNWLTTKKSLVIDAKSVCCVTNATGDLGSRILEISYSCEDLDITSMAQERIKTNLLQPVLIILGILGSLSVIGIVLGFFKVRLNRSVSKKCSGQCLHTETSFTKKQENNILYDAFVSYSMIDAPFVRDVFVAELEHGERSYRVCLPNRDCETGGTYIEDIISHCMESSYKIILVLTNNYIENEWCKFSYKTLYFDQFKKMKRKIIVVKCGEFSEKDLDPDLQYIVKNSTRLKYEDKSFWSKLHRQLPKVPSECSNKCIVKNMKCMTSRSVPNISNNLNLKHYFPSYALGQPQNINSSYRSLHHNHIHSPMDSLDLDNAFASMETMQSTLGPSLNHSYMSIDYTNCRNSHVYSSIDEASRSSLLCPSELPSLNLLQQELYHQQNQQHYDNHQNTQVCGAMQQPTLQTCSQNHQKIELYQKQPCCLHQQHQQQTLKLNHQQQQQQHMYHISTHKEHHQQQHNHQTTTNKHQQQQQQSHNNCQHTQPRHPLEEELVAQHSHYLEQPVNESSSGIEDNDLNKTHLL